MQAMILQAPGQRLTMTTIDPPALRPDQVLVQVKACGVCRTDLHVVDGDLPGSKKPVIPGHEIVGTVIAVGSEVDDLRQGDRVGVPWLGWTCGTCNWCRTGRENLCDRARFTGHTIDGGYAELAVADHRFCFPLPDALSDEKVAPLLCAGLIGHRAYKMAGDGRRIGIYGFGAAAHIIAQVAAHQGREVFAFTRAGDTAAQALALDLGASWAGSSTARPLVALDAALIFAPVGGLLPAALAATTKGGTVICAGIHMTDIPSFPYRLLWEERVVRSVANLTRQDGREFLQLATTIPFKIHTEPFPLGAANDALDRLRAGQVQGAAVLLP